MTMTGGSIKAETRPSQRNPDQPRGPYFKHQVWEDRQNKTRRIPTDQADALTRAIEGRKKFEHLALLDRGARYLCPCSPCLWQVSKHDD